MTIMTQKIVRLGQPPSPFAIPYLVKQGAICMKLDIFIYRT